MGVTRIATTGDQLQLYYPRDPLESLEHYITRLEGYKSYYDNISNKGEVGTTPWSRGRDYSVDQLLTREDIEFEISVDQDIPIVKENSGILPDLTLPGHNYIGPGNTLDEGKPVSGADEDALKHDTAYSKPDITSDEVREADTQAINDFGDHFADNPFDIGAGLGYLGLKTKKGIESKIGVQYPDTMGSVRKAGEQGGPAGKKQNTSGTFAGEELNPGTGGGGSGPTSDNSGAVVSVATPFISNQPAKLSFNKVHRMLSFGLAHSVIKLNATQDGMTTALAEIPWDKPFFYMSPSEYSLLPPGTVAKRAHISVVQRNPRVAFETNSSSTDLATFNQNKFLQTAKGLNIAAQGTNFHYTAFNATEPMIPTTLTQPDYDEVVDALYGVKQDDAAWITTVPALAYGVPYKVDNYWTTMTLGVAHAQQANGGWSDFMQHIVEKDMTTTVGQVVMECDYNFKFAPLTEPHKSGSQFAYPGVGAQAFETNPGVAPSKTHKRNRITTMAGQSNIETSNNDRKFGENNSNLSTHINVMEQCQIYSGWHSEDYSCRIQPSAHVGVKPVPKLSSNAAGHSINTWTDIQAYFEITATLELEYTRPQEFPFMERFCTTFGAHHERIANAYAVQNTATPTLDGLYTLTTV